MILFFTTKKSLNMDLLPVIKVRVAHAPGMLTKGFRWSRWRGKRSRHSWRMRNPQFCVCGKKPIDKTGLCIFENETEAQVNPVRQWFLMVGIDNETSSSPPKSDTFCKHSWLPAFVGICLILTEIFTMSTGEVHYHQWVSFTHVTYYLTIIFEDIRVRK